MSNQIEAIYENGMFRPLAPVELPEHQRVMVNLPDDVDLTNNNDESIESQEPWTKEKNARRCDLIDKEIEGTITGSEAIELAALQSQAIAYRDTMTPIPTEGAAKLHRELLRKKRAAQG